MKTNVRHDLQKIIFDIFNYAYTNSEIRIPATTCREVGKILHTAMYLEEVDQKIPAFNFSTQVTKQLLENSKTTLYVAKEVRIAYKKMNKKWKIYDSDIIFSDKDIGYICAKLNKVYVSNPQEDIFGDALEIFRSKWAKQEGGQFFTDQQITSLAMTLLDFDPTRGDDLIDMCAGTGGFLLAGLNRIKNIVERQNGQELDVIKLAAGSLKGIEIDRGVCELGNATLSARTGKHAEIFINQGNSLDSSCFKKPKSVINPGHHLCAATNPPFGAKVTVKDLNILSQYELAQAPNTSKHALKGIKNRNRSPDILFIEQNLKILKPGAGRLAIVVPYQILSGPQTLYVREWILRHAKIEAVIDLPGETFQPHTGTKTSLVLLKRRKVPLKKLDGISKETIFMSAPKWIGHDRRGNLIYKKDKSGQATTTLLSDIPDVENAYLHFKSGKSFADIHAHSFKISASKILDDKLLRINALFHTPTSKTLNTPQYFSQNSDWKIKKIGDVIEDIFFPGRFKRDYVDFYPGAVPFLGGSNITEFIVSTDKWLRHDDPRLKQLAVQSGWLLVTRSGSTGIVSSVPKAWDGFAMSEHVIRIIPDNAKLDSMYLLAFLKTKICQNEMAKGIFGSVIDEITPETIKNIEIPIPNEKSLYLEVCDQVRKAEQAKQATLENLYGAVKKLDDLFLPDLPFSLVA